MFQRRPRLRFDGLYYFATTKLLHGLNEGRGMKEANVDFYNPAGRWVTSYRVLRFYPDGKLFSYLCSSHTPADVRKAASAVHPDKPTTSRARLKDLNWGSYELHEPAEGGGGSRAGSPGGPSRGSHSHGTSLSASVLQHSERYPDMAPCHIHYELELRPGEDLRVGAAGSNCKLYLSAHSLTTIINGRPDGEHFPVPPEAAYFITFEGPLPPMVPPRSWVSGS